MQFWDKCIEPDLAQSDPFKVNKNRDQYFLEAVLRMRMVLRKAPKSDSAHLQTIVRPLFMLHIASTGLRTAPDMNQSSGQETVGYITCGFGYIERVTERIPHR